MNKVWILLSLILLITVDSAGIAPCPLQSQIGSIVSSRVTVSSKESLVSLVPNTDVQCYNYSLPYTFSSAPQIAIAVHDFESRTTNDLYFSIKSTQSQSLTHVPFLIRTQWRYTYWNKIAFSFIAEDRSDIEAGYYQVDSGALGGCQAGKNIQVLLPFRQIGLIRGKINHNLFLHGFEISAIKYTDTTYSPFEIQIVQSNTNSSGIAALITTTTITQVHSIHISYIAWVNSNLTMATGEYSYQYSTSGGISHTPLQNIGRNYARIFGITGFIFNHNYQAITFSTQWTGTKFNFDMGSQKMIQYFTFQYIFFIGSECSECPGFPYIYKDTCRNVCPPGSFPTAENICIECGENYFWNGIQCVKLCPEGQTLNATTNDCQCPAGSHWTGTNCITCLKGRVFDNTTKMCVCPQFTRWNGFTCAQIQKCINGKEWNMFEFRCVCPIGTFWNGTYCTRKNICSGGQVLNNQNVCVCPDGTYLRDGWCQSTGCTGGQQWNGRQCACPNGYNFNGTVCLLCINGQVWDPATRTCQCPINYTWNGNLCEKQRLCSGGRVYFKEYDQCLCPEGTYWNGVKCIERAPCCCGQIWNETSFECNCPTGFNYDGQKCVLCVNGKIWNENTRTCVCPSATQWNGEFCALVQTCFGGMIWNQNTWACECPSTTVWNSQYCIANPCKGGSVWDNTLKRCICVGGKIMVNGICTTPEYTCQPPKQWSPSLQKCVCPPGQWDNVIGCELIPTCIGNQRYNPLNNKCQCPFNLVFLASKNQCGDPTCPVGERWNGYGCVAISCPPGSFYNGTECVCPELDDKCLPWEYFDGQKCVYSQDTCPLGTRWDKNKCVPINDCPIGYYGERNHCKPFPQKCLPPTTWNNNGCQASGGNCPLGTYAQGGKCSPYSSCQNGQQWDYNMLKCTCPQGTGWNGQTCVNCDSGQIWSLEKGCSCPDGHFFKGSRCQKPNQAICQSIPNAYWSNSQNLCLCDPGFTVKQFSCICEGIPFNHYCDRCAHRPNSFYDNGICKCMNGFTLYGQECLPDLNNGTDTPAQCGVGTYFHTQQKRCLACPDGCLSCEDSYKCNACDPNFMINVNNDLCYEICGDGLRYVDECDDGNDRNGDGCSKNCEIEDEFTCRGGSPTSPDECFRFNPDSLEITVIGQIRYSTRITVNVKLNYMPRELLQSKACNDLCKSVVTANIISGDSNFMNINSQYQPGSRYTFSITIEFGRPYIGKFDISVGVQSALVNQYFGGVNVAPQVFEINPAYLAIATPSKEDRIY